MANSVFLFPGGLRLEGGALSIPGGLGLSGHQLFTPDNTYDIGASGANRPKNIYAAGSITAGTSLISAQQIFIGNGLAGFKGISDGVIQLRNSSDTDFNRLQFGGTTSSFPSLKRSTTILQARLADDSAYARFQALNFLSEDGTSLLPAFSFTSEPTLGFWRSSAGNITFQGIFTSTGSIISSTGNVTGGNLIATASGELRWLSRSNISSPADGLFSLLNQARTIGSHLKFDALPTIASGFGTSPSITAGSTPLAGSINVGTGGVATSGVINFNGTAFPSAPFVVCMNTTTGAVVRAVATTTQLTITAPVAFTASDVISWICISSK